MYTETIPERGQTERLVEKSLSWCIQNSKMILFQQVSTLPPFWNGLQQAFLAKLRHFWEPQYLGVPLLAGSVGSSLQHDPHNPRICSLAPMATSYPKAQPLAMRDPRQESREMTCSSQASASKASPKVCKIPRDAQRADKKEIAGKRSKERPLMGKKCVIFPEGGLSSYDIQPLY